MVKHLVASVEMIPMPSTLGYTSLSQYYGIPKPHLEKAFCWTHSQDPQKIQMDSKDCSFKVASARENKKEFVV